jgi:uncharacterized membrane protein
MAKVSRSITIHQPVSTVYNQWTQFEDFPQFMEGVQKVVQLDDRRLHWVAKIGPVTREWDADITEQEPEKVIAWRATDGTENAGRVSFRPESPGGTTVDLELEFEPENFTEKAGEALGVVEGQVESDLERFRNFIESRGEETGAWRGRIGS